MAVEESFWIAPGTLPEEGWAPAENTPLLVSPEDVEAAARRIAGAVNLTAVMTSRTLTHSIGAFIYMKCENFQRAGAFKFRGAINAITRLPETARRRGVVTYSSGNHAQALALAGSLTGVKVTVIMPRDAPAVKREATLGYGAEVIEYDPAETTREALAARRVAECGQILIPPYDHPWIVEGQGTAALELFSQFGPMDYLLVPCGGGGLLSGCALAARLAAPACRVIGVEPERADDAARSFRERRLRRVHHPETLADGARTPCLGHVTFPLILRHVADFVTVSEAVIPRAVRFLWERMKLLVEPTGALGLAALLEGRFAPPAGARVGVILSGGNVDLREAARWLRLTD